MNPRYYHKIVGGNFRLDALQAVVVHVKLKHLDDWSEKRQQNAARYDRLFQECGLAGPTVQLPKVVQSRHIFNQYILRVPRRDDLLAHLKKNDIGCEVYYPVPAHLQECFSSYGFRKGDYPESEKAALETIALPIYPELTDEQARFVVETIRKFYAG
jgi:dTDP-4-amino-4,6-dideoxygalactose transaminase